jgi:carbonic anhydrase/acetyltransferase-like protein (isoleucine patch superfamily)
MLGSPAKVVRQLTEAEILFLRASAEKYITVSRAHAALQANTE